MIIIRGRVMIQWHRRVPVCEGESRTYNDLLLLFLQKVADFGKKFNVG